MSNQPLPAGPFVTTVVGSLPKPAWLQEKLPLNASGKQVHGKGATWLLEGEQLHAAQDDLADPPPLRHDTRRRWTYTRSA